MAQVCLRVWGVSRLVASDGQCWAATALWVAMRASTASSLSGRPVRVGNAAFLQVQNDVYGQVLLSLFPLYTDNRIILGRCGWGMPGRRGRRRVPAASPAGSPQWRRSAGRIVLCGLSRCT